MRELFDEVAGHSPLDPGEAVRKTSRTPPRKRFYKEVGVGEADGGFTVTLDGKQIKTPSGKVVLVPKRAIADAIAAEWAAQGETIDPLTMPMTRFANSVVQSVVDRAELVAEPKGTDVLFPHDAADPRWYEQRERAQRLTARSIGVPHDFLFRDRLGASGIRFQTYMFGELA